MAAKKKGGDLGIGDILCPLVKKPEFDLKSDSVYRVYNDQLSRYVYGRDITIADGHLSAARSFKQDKRVGWCKGDGDMWPSVTVEHRLDLHDDGKFKMSYFNLSEVPNFKWASISESDAIKMRDMMVEERDRAFMLHLQGCGVLKRLWYLPFSEFLKTTWLFREMKRLVS